ncbi:hypothetical protein [Streptococcus pyogenes]|uniref:hypothetical protein n=1 Tax=Streptococcus pyogenes TaxID=1314 RepID=UPI0010D01F5E|nr:hypothetical protein [Streptococcus pyogenes]VGV96919.1 Uncharacterised protein [Streptococcus pyogenes]VHA93250.1 Uncharacterised protein [Streptococcus pyogenes]VHC61364.1 Uncharacterised protein [Streptococcus pyogenes]VHD09804.1 Uncharacterised protein [Streptococcus pyogenes]
MKTKSKRFLNLATLCLALLGTTLLMEQPVKAQTSTVRSSVRGSKDYQRDYEEGLKAGKEAARKKSAPESPTGTDRYKPGYADGYSEGYYYGYCEEWDKLHPNGGEDSLEGPTDGSQREESQTPNEGEDSIYEQLSEIAVAFVTFLWSLFGFGSE